MGQHAVLVGAPLGELGQVVEDALRVGVEDVRAVRVDQDAVVVVVVVGIAADVGAPVDEQDLLAGLRGQALGQHAAGEAGPDDQIVEHDVISFSRPAFSPGRASIAPPPCASR